MNDAKLRGKLRHNRESLALTYAEVEKAFLDSPLPRGTIDRKLRQMKFAIDEVLSIIEFAGES